MITDPRNKMKLASDHCNRVTSVEDRARFYHKSSYVALEGFFSKTCGGREAHAYTTGELHHYPPLSLTMVTKVCIYKRHEDFLRVR